MSRFSPCSKKVFLFLGLFFLCALHANCAPIHSKVSSLNSEQSESSDSVGSARDPEEVTAPPETPMGEKQLCDDLLGDSFQREREEVCQIITDERQQRGLSGLELDAQLSFVAQEYAEEMAKKGFFSHTSPEGEGPGDRLRRHNVRSNGWGENIAQGYVNSSSVMEGWMNSSGHRANILSRGFDKVGVGVYKSYWVQVFITE